MCEVSLIVKSEQEQFQVWRQSISGLSDNEVLQMMRTAKDNLVKFHAPGQSHESFAT